MGVNAEAKPYSIQQCHLHIPNNISRVFPALGASLCLLLKPNMQGQNEDWFICLRRYEIGEIPEAHLGPRNSPVHLLTHSKSGTPIQRFHFLVLFCCQTQGKPLCADCNFEKPAKHGGYVQLAAGAAFFGMGWGSIGICPGPGIAGVIPYLTFGTWAGASFASSLVMMCISWLVTEPRPGWLCTPWINQFKLGLGCGTFPTTGGGGGTKEPKTASGVVFIPFGLEKGVRRSQV